MSPSVSANSRDIRRIKSKALLSTTTTTTDRSDPLSCALLPPPDETASERQARLQHEKEAKQRSDEIDRLLKQQQGDSLTSLPSSSDAAGGNSKKGRVYKMVLLGQAGAGKTTVLKQMRLLYDPKSHEKDRRGWSRIVLLNLTSSSRVLLQTMARYMEERGECKSAELSRSLTLGSSGHRGGDEVSEEGRKELAASVGPRNEVNTSSMPWSEHLPKVMQLERELRAELGAFDEEVTLSQASGGGLTANADGAVSSRGSAAYRAKTGEKSPLLLRPGWQGRLFTYARRSFSISPNARSGSPDNTTATPEDCSASAYLRSIQTDILGVWNDDIRCRALRKRGLFLDGQSDAATSYFLDNYIRIVSPTYQPSDDDILHSRVRTVGVTEDIFRVDRSLIYRIYDVGGSRSQRAAWAPFLDDVESIIFLAPLSAFDQPLVEDPSINRLSDTFALFNSSVSNPLLRKASMILFLNKIDLLEKKLKQGILLQRYWVEYDGDNDFEAVWRWFRGKFRDALRRVEEEDQTKGERGERVKRRLYVHTTVATSTKQIGAILMSVKDGILRENLRVTGLVG